MTTDVHQRRRRMMTLTCRRTMAAAFAASAEELLLAHEARVAIRASLMVLPPRERRILEMLFGFYGETTPLAVIAEQMEISKQRCGQLRRRAILRLWYRRHTLDSVDEWDDSFRPWRSPAAERLKFEGRLYECVASRGAGGATVTELRAWVAAEESEPGRIICAVARMLARDTLSRQRERYGRRRFRWRYFVATGDGR